MKLKDILLPACLLLAVQAGAFDRAHWMAELVRQNPDIRLSQLSIPMAHDAATWHAWSNMCKDQCCDEKTMFENGVRAFDFRIAYDEYNDNRDIDGDGETESIGHMRHGNLGPDIFYNLHNFYDEMNFLPTADQLVGECAFYFFQYEGDDETDQKDKAAIDQVVQFILQKYDNNTSMFVAFKPDLKLADVQGKIVLLAEEALANKSTYNLDNEIPIAVTGGGFCDHAFIRNYQTKDEARVFRSDHYDINLSLETLYNDATKMYTKFWNNIDDENSQNYFARINFNNWRFPDGGIAYAADGENLGIGMNHLMTKYLQTSRLPVGFAAFDFCTTKKYENTTTWGFALSDEIIRHNFMDGRFVKEVKLAKDASNGATARNLLTDAGYEVVKTDDGYANINRAAGGGTDGAYLYMGVKYTSNPDEAITDLLVIDYGKESHSNTTFDWNGRTYTQVEGLTTDGTFNGDLNSGEGGDNIFLFATKVRDLNDKPYQSLSVIREEEDDEVGMLTYDDGEWEWNAHADMNKGCGILASAYIYLKYKTHTHTYPEASDRDYIDYDTDGYHYLQCRTCTKTVRAHEVYPDVPDVHNITISTTNKGYHTSTCSACNYEVSNFCTSESYNDNGFGICSVCNNPKAYQPAEYHSESDNVNGAYQIANAGQLYWFKNHVTYGLGNSANATLVNNIVVNNDVNQQDPSTLYEWAPICKGGDSNYCGTFDGQGHTISGLYSTEVADSVGLFARLSEATVKNLGIKNSIFKGANYLGSFAGYAENSTLENVFSTADITQSSDGNIYHGGFVGEGDNTTFTCGYYNGTITPYSTTEKYNPLGGLFNCTADNIFVSNNNRYYKLITGVGTYKPAEFYYGNICRVLNVIVPEGDTTWGQNLGTDDNPTFDSEGLHHTRTMTNQWGTICLPFEATIGSDYDFYTLQEVTGTSITLAKVTGTLPAGTPALVLRDEDVTDIDVTHSGNVFVDAPLAGSSAGSLTLTGSFAVKDITSEDGYVLASNKFWKIADVKGSNNVYCAPFRSYLAGTNETKEFSLILNDDQQDALRALNAITDGSATYYDLDGRQLNQLQTGVNIVKYSNGTTRKIIIK